jgi:hypothetical protein
MCHYSSGYNYYDIKLTMRLVSGTTQKTEGFEVRENWVLGCVDNVI